MTIKTFFKGSKMAKSRQQHSIESAILGLTKALKIDAIANPTEEQKKERETAILSAANIVETSGIITTAQHGDDNLETLHQVDAVFDEAGRDRVELQRQGALNGARATVEALALEEAEQEALDEEQVEEQIEEQE